MKKFSKEYGDKLANAAYEILNDPKKWAAAQEYFKEAANDFSKKLADINKEAEDDQLISGNPKNDCDHGVVFNEEEAKFLEASEVRKKYPRGWGLCPKGCGFNGTAYASYKHYLYGDW